MSSSWATRDLAGRLLGEFTRRQATLSTAESLTGGLISAAVTNVPGASAVFLGAIVTYSTTSKHTLLGVDAELLHSRGAVDPEVALSMARGTRASFGADWGIAVTGVAGPEPQDGRPVGTVFVGLSGPDGREWPHELTLTGCRTEIREQTVHNALLLLLEALNKSSTHYTKKSTHLSD